MPHCWNKRFGSKNLFFEEGLDLPNLQIFSFVFKGKNCSTSRMYYQDFWMCPDDARRRNGPTGRANVS